MPPAVLLLATTLPENLGAVARVMANLGLEDLRLVGPVASPEDPRALAVAAAGAGLLAQARRFEGLRPAIADLRELWGASALEKSLEKPVLGPRALAPRLGGEGVGLLFGPERSGLGYEEASLCTGLVRIPTRPEARALNLAQAVAILAWEWAAAGEPAPTGPLAAPRAEQLGLLDELDRRLRTAGHFSEEKLRVKAWRNLRTALLRAGFTSAELRTLRGVVEALGRPGRPPEGA